MRTRESHEYRSSFYQSALVAEAEGLLDYFPIAEMLWRRPIKQSEGDVSNLVATGENTTDERPEGHITNTDDMSKHSTSEVNMPTDRSPMGRDPVPKFSHETHSREVIDHVTKMNGTFYGAALLDAWKSFTRQHDPSVMLENSTERRSLKVPLMEDLVGLTDEKEQASATSIGTAMKEEVVEDADTP